MQKTQMKIYSGLMRFALIRKAILLPYAILFILLLAACGELEQSFVPPEEMPELTPLSTPLTRPFEVSAELETLTQTIDDTYFSKYGRRLFPDEHWWMDYGTDKDAETDKELHQYVYLEDHRSYLDPNITVITDEDSGGIISVSVSQSYERFTDQTAQTFEEFYYCVATAFMPDIPDNRLEELLKAMCETENWLDHDEEPYPATLYFTDEIYCYAYFRDGSETIYFGTDVSEKLPDFTSNNVNCVDINQENAPVSGVDLSFYFDGLSEAAFFLDKSGNYSV